MSKGVSSKRQSEAELQLNPGAPLSEAMTRGGRADTTLSEEQAIELLHADPAGVTAFFMRDGVDAQTAQLFTKHQLRGSALNFITEDHLKEMGVSVIGIRVDLLRRIDKVQTALRIARRNFVIWEGDEDVARKCYGSCPAVCDLGCCPNRPRHFKLTNAKLAVLGSNSTCLTRCLRNLCSCCVPSNEKFTNNIDLGNIKDIDTAKVGATCCETAAFIVYVDSDTAGDGADDSRLRFNTKDGPIFEQKLRNAMEESSTMNR